MDEITNDDSPQEEPSPGMDGRFRLKISHDSLTVHLFQLSAPTGSGKPVTVEDVLSKISKSKIKHGLDQKAIADTLAQVEQGNLPDDPVLIAQGQAAEHGTDAKVEWFVDATSQDELSRIVMPDQLIANFHPASKGVPGVDIYGKAIRARPGIMMNLATGDGVSSKMAGEVHEYHADSLGILDNINEKLSVRIPGLAVDKDELTATIDLFTRTGGDNPTDITAQHIIDSLNKNKIIFGIDEEVISNTLNEAKESGNEHVSGVVVAKGIAPVNGNNAEINWLIDIDATSKGERLTASDQIILRKTFSTQGVNGKNVYGKDIKSTPGKDIVVKTGKGIEVNQTLEIIEYSSKETGYARLDKGNLVIATPAIEISKNEITATMDIYAKSAGENAKDFEAKHIIELLNSAKITFGINEDHINKLLAEAKNSQEGYLKNATVAQGVLPVDGADGTIVWEIETDSKEENDLLVIPGQSIAIRTFSTPGEDGNNIRGKPVKPKPGTDIKIMKGTGISSNIGGNKEEYKSDLLGFVGFVNGTLSIHNPVVNISSDKLSATMDIYGHSGGKQKNEIQTAYVIDAIKHSKITFGFQDNAISQAIEEARQAKTGMVPDVEVVKGIKEINGDDGRIDWNIDIQDEDPSKRIVLSGMHIASRIPLTKGTPGKDVFSKPIQPIAGKDQQIKAGELVEFTKKEDHDEFSAAIYGIAELSDDTLSVSKSNLEISEDGLSASIDIYSKSGGENPGFVETDNIIHMLNKCGVTFGIDENEIETSLFKLHDTKDDSAKGHLSDVVVAKGIDKKDGVPAILQVDNNIAPGKRRANGTIDLHERSYPWDVSNDTVLGKFTQAVMAVNGTKVTGKTIVAEEVNEVNIKLEGIRMEEDGTLIANLDGTLLIDEFNLRVTDVLLIDGDVDMSTGNIRTKSAVQITGFVTAGFVVEALGEIIVSENIEDAIVRSGSSVVVHGGIRGPRSEVFAANNIKTSFVEYGKLVAKNDILIDNSCIDGHLVAGNDIRIGPDPGTLIAGRCEAIRQISVTNIGHTASGMCEIHLGVSSKKIDRKNKLMQQEGPLIADEKKELAMIQKMLEQSKDAALRVKGKILSDVELYIGINVLKILDEKSYLDYYIDPDTHKITFRAYDERSRIPVIVKEEDDDTQKEIKENI